MPSEVQMYRAILRRDSSFDGIFLTAVKTTGIFCRPTCPARKPKLQSIEFFSTPRQAMLAGYRPCKRCRPMDMHGKPPAWVRSLIELIEKNPTQRIRSSDLRSRSIDPARASRFFKRNYNMTFQAYHRARRMGLALAAVRAGHDVTQVGLRHGFDSASGFHDAFVRVFGSPPARSNSISCLLSRWLDTPLGAMLAIANNEGICLLEFVDRRMLETQLTTLRRRFSGTGGAAIVPGNNNHLDQLADELNQYFAGRLATFNVPLVIRGTPFQLKVWQRLMEIPHGQILSYSQLAKDIRAPGAQRAVGKANGDNRIAIIIPCHRVIKNDHTLSGYGGGVWRKQWLLDLERNPNFANH